MLPSVRVFATSRDRTVAVLAVVVVAGALLAGSVLVGRAFPFLARASTVREYVVGFGVWAPVAFVLLQALQVVVAPIPGQALVFVSGYLFGLLPGTLYSLVGATLGTYVALLLARRFGRPLVERLVTDEALDVFDDYSRDHGAFALFLVFLVPGLPDDVVCFAAGLTPLRIRTLLAVAVVGRLPGYFLAALAGSELAAADPVASAVVVSVLALLSVVGYVYRNEFLEWTDRG
jgi:uncharacterized membrane protein YdjX (TVP38/TMEM64 family)